MRARPRREEAWSSPRASLSAVPEGDETEGELQEAPTRMQREVFLGPGGPRGSTHTESWTRGLTAEVPALEEDPSEAFETPEMEDCRVQEANSPQGLPPEAPCDEPRAILWQPACARIWTKLLGGR